MFTSQCKAKNLRWFSTKHASASISRFKYLIPLLYSSSHNSSVDPLVAGMTNSSMEHLSTTVTPESILGRFVEPSVFATSFLRLSCSKTFWAVKANWHQIGGFVASSSQSYRLILSFFVVCFSEAYGSRGVFGQCCIQHKEFNARICHC